MTLPPWLTQRAAELLQPLSRTSHRTGYGYMRWPIAASQTVPGRGKRHTISGDELCARIDDLGLTYVAAAANLGLTQDELYKQMSDRRKVSRQTEIIIDQLKELQLRSRKRQAEPPKGKPARRRRDLARYLYPTPRRGKCE
jgi:hypothetical protein